MQSMNGALEPELGGASVGGVGGGGGCRGSTEVQLSINGSEVTDCAETGHYLHQPRFPTVFFVCRLLTRRFFEISRRSPSVCHLDFPGARTVG